MPMKKDVQIEIHSRQTPADGGGAEEFHRKMPGSCLIREGCYYLSCTSLGEAPVSYLIRLQKDGLSLREKGSIRTHMELFPGKICETAYVTPYGAFSLRIRTRSYRLETADPVPVPGTPWLIAEVDYSLILNQIPCSDCRLRLTVFL